MKLSKRLMRQWEGKSKVELEEMLSEFRQEQRAGGLTVRRLNYLNQVVPTLQEALRRWHPPRLED